MCKAVSGAIVVIVNLLFVPIGLALIIFGALIKWNPDLLVNKISSTIMADSVDESNSAQQMIYDIVQALGGYGLVIFIFGIFLFILSFCAVCGVCCKSKLLLGVYAACLILIFVALLIFTIVFGVRSSYFKQESEEELQKLIQEKYQMNNEQPVTTGFTRWFNAFQEHHYCCGSINYKDFESNPSFQRQAYKIPSSCCRIPSNRACWASPDGFNSYMNRGCNTYIWEQVSRQFNYVLYGLIALLIVVFLFAVLSIYLLSVYSRNELQSV